MRKSMVERSRALVAVRHFGGSHSSNVMKVVVAFFMLTLAVLVMSRNAHAQVPPPVFTPGVVEFGSEPPKDGEFYFPDLTKHGGPAAGWRAVPAASEKPTGEGFPQTFTAKFKVKVNKGAVTVEDAAGVVARTLKGRVLGVLGVRTWMEDVKGVEGPQLHLGVTLVLETVSAKGHVYRASVKGADKGHENEVVLVVEPTEVKEAEAEVTFVHQDVAAGGGKAKSK